MTRLTSRPSWTGHLPDPTQVPVLDVLKNEGYASSVLISTGSNGDFISEKLVDHIGVKKVPLSYAYMFQDSQVTSKVNLKFSSNGIDLQNVLCDPHFDD
ncbi:hypothetical protein JCM33374_g4020 [Metschnikowia sp. JCM 33374]|nr:hypothetical protein JCM33374_g4020 [Metschnikowia sp. JCM 33374]